MIIADALGSDPLVVHTVLPGDTIADTVDLLAEFGIGAVIVTTDGRTIEGIISERDVVRYLAHEQEGTLRIKVEDLMTRNVVGCRRDDSLEAVARQMIDGRFRHMPVVDENGHLIAMISLGDLMDARLRATVDG